MKLGYLVNKIPTQKLNKESNKLVDSSTLLGVEVELENFTTPKVGSSEMGYWVWKADHSLRNNGMEFVFNEPLCGEDAVRAITWLCDTAKKQDYKISNLCGIHTHLDVRNMEIVEFRTFCAAFAVTEPLIYNWVGNDRSSNMFCLPWYQADGDLSKISGLIKAPREEVAKDILDGLAKYSGLNLNSLPRFGTVEFRMLQTTFDESRIMDWLNIILSLKRYAINPANSATRCCTEIKTLGPYASACKIFGAELTNKMWYPGYVKDAIGLGLVTADWFLDTSRDIYLKDRPRGSIFDWSRLNKTKKPLADDGEHPGLSKWMQAKTTKGSASNSKKLHKSLFSDQADNISWNNLTAGGFQAFTQSLQAEAVAAYGAGSATPPIEWPSVTDHIVETEEEED